MEINQNRHSLGGNNYHMQFTPKRRKTVYRNRKIRALVKAALKYKAFKLGVTIEALEFGPDHLHLFISNCRKYSVSQLAQHFKGYSSRIVRKHLPYDVMYFNNGRAFWSGGYFYESIGRVTSDVVKYYIERQQKKHWIRSKSESFEAQSPMTQMSLESF
jgi:putative transposase